MRQRIIFCSLIQLKFMKFLNFWTQNIATPEFSFWFLAQKFKHFIDFTPLNCIFLRENSKIWTVRVFNKIEFYDKNWDTTAVCKVELYFLCASMGLSIVFRNKEVYVSRKCSRKQRVSRGKWVLQQHWKIVEKFVTGYKAWP